MRNKKKNEYFTSFDFGGFSLFPHPPLKDNEVIGLVGMPGSGKTCLATKILLKEQKRGRTIYTNDDYINDFADYTFKPSNLGAWNFPNKSVVFIDEMSLNGYDCRDNKNFSSKQLLDFWKKHRQEHTAIVWTNQAYSETDIKVRDFLTTSIYLCENLGLFCRATKIHKTEKLNLETGRIDYQFYTKGFFGCLFGKGERIYCNPRRYGKHYQSVHPTPKRTFVESQALGLVSSNAKEL